MKNIVKAILFDIDDTLYDRVLAQVKVLEIMVQSLPLLFNNLQISKIRGAFLESDRITTADFSAGVSSTNIRDSRSRLFLKLLGISESNTEKITEIYVQQYPRCNTPLTGAVQLIRELSLRYKLGAISNGLPDVQYRKLETLGLRKMLSCIILSEEIGIRKPDVRIFLKAVGALDVLPAQCLHIGDSYASDVVGAMNAGMKSCWFNHSKTSLSAGDLEPDFTVKDLLEIPALLK